MDALLAADAWRVVDRLVFPARPAEKVDPGGLDLSPAARRVLAAMPGGIYRHQGECLEHVRAGRDVCVTTGTASGKTLAFQAAAIDRLAREPGARVAVLYPLRALGQQQEERWRSAVADAGIPLSVARIDGSTPMQERLRLLRQSRLVLFTPDVLHAWLLSNLALPEVRAYVGRLNMVILDEAHSYSGVFGSNAALLFRRLRYAVTLLGPARGLQWFCASATMTDPAGHVFRLCGADPVVIGPDRDTSPRQEMEVALVAPPENKDVNTLLGRLFAALVSQQDHRFIAFADSRRQVEILAAIAARGGRPLDEADDDSVPGGDRPPPRVLPYRSGYEESDRAQIQHWLQGGQVSGVISTSALELGLDIGDLDVGIQVGVPRSLGSLLQRLGRVGRSRAGTFLVIAGDSPYDRVVLRTPRSLFERALPGSTVYLENRRIQYIHAMCLAGMGGEAEALGAGEGWEPADAESAVWPTGFRELCRSERSGQVPQELQALKADGGADPWHAFPLRDAGVGFAVERRAAAGSDRQPLGSISHAQMLREAYPGAVYYYMARPHRVTAVYMTQRKVVVVPERRYTTKPLFVPPAIYPNLAGGLVGGEVHGDLTVVEAEMQIAEAVRGWEERRGPNATAHTYPCQYWQRNTLRRDFFTTGVCVMHPAMGTADSTLLACAADGLYEAFVVEVPTESAEVSRGTGRVRDGAPVPPGTRFLALYDSTYGSLRLTSGLLAPGVLARCLGTGAAMLREACRQAEKESPGDGGLAETVYGYPSTVCLDAADLLELLAADAGAPSAALPWIRVGEASHETAATVEPGAFARVILVGESGILLQGVEEEFIIDAIFMHPRDGLMYRGRRVGEARGPVATLFPVERVRPIPGITRTGRYVYESGEVLTDDHGT